MLSNKLANMNYISPIDHPANRVPPPFSPSPSNFEPLNVNFERNMNIIDTSKKREAISKVQTLVNTNNNEIMRFNEDFVKSYINQPALSGFTLVSPKKCLINQREAMIRIGLINQR